jgi:peroxiredoxin/mono/diheme cytochrome c family protein
MTRRLIVGSLIVCTLMASQTLVALGADAAHFAALQLTRLEQAVALPDMRVPDIEGQEVALRSFQGKVVLINFWTTWCSWCQRERPALEALYTQYQDQGLVILAVNIGETAAQVKAYVIQHGLSFPHVLDSDQQVASWFGVRGTPSNFLVDRLGNIVGGGSGYRDWAAPAAHQLIGSLLAQGEATATETARTPSSWHTADPANAEQVQVGQAVYAQHCAVCHGAHLEGQPNWKQPLPTGGLPAPPHDETGHTWHHADALLFKIVKLGGQSGVADPNFKSNMPAFQNVLSNAEIWAVLAFIKSRWPPTIRTFQDRVNAREQ